MIVFIWFISLISSIILHANFDHLNGVKVPIAQSIFKPSWPAYLEPNEKRPSSFGISSLASQDASELLVSVGTFRTLVAYAWAPNITHLLMADIDNRVVKFNNAHLSFIKCIAARFPDNTSLQRAYYLSAAHRLNLSNDELKALHGPALSARKVQKKAQAFLPNDDVTDPCLKEAIQDSKAFDIMTTNNLFESMFATTR